MKPLAGGRRGRCEPDAGLATRLTKPFAERIKALVRPVAPQEVDVELDKVRPVQLKLVHLDALRELFVLYHTNFVEHLLLLLR